MRAASYQRKTMLKLSPSLDLVAVGSTELLVLISPLIRRILRNIMAERPIGCRDFCGSPSPRWCAGRHRRVPSKSAKIRFADFAAVACRAAQARRRGLSTTSPEDFRGCLAWRIKAARQAAVQRDPDFRTDATALIRRMGTADSATEICLFGCLAEARHANRLWA
jgi:hypothetical protein